MLAKKSNEKDGSWKWSLLDMSDHIKEKALKALKNLTRQTMSNFPKLTMLIGPLLIGSGTHDPDDLFTTHRIARHNLLKIWRDPLPYFVEKPYKYIGGDLIDSA